MICFCRLRGGTETLDNRVEQRSQPFFKRRGNCEYQSLALLFESLHDLRKLLRVEQIALGECDDLRLVGEPFTILAKLGANHAPAFERVFARRIDQVEKEPRPLDMSEEAVADPRA